MSRARAELSRGGLDEAKARDGPDARGSSASSSVVAAKAGGASSGAAGAGGGGGAAAVAAAGAGGGAAGAAAESHVLLFDACKREAGHPERNMKKFARRAKGRFMGGVNVNKDELSLAALRAARVAVFAAPRDAFTAEEVRRAACGSGGRSSRSGAVWPGERVRRCVGPA